MYLLPLCRYIYLYLNIFNFILSYMHYLKLFYSLDMYSSVLVIFTCGHVYTPNMPYLEIFTRTYSIANFTLQNIHVFLALINSY